MVEGKKEREKLLDVGDNLLLDGCRVGLGVFQLVVVHRVL